MSELERDVRTRVDAEQEGATLAAVVRGAYAGLAWSRARELCRRGKVQVNGAVQADPARRLRQGDLVVVQPRARRLRGDGLEDRAVVHVDRNVIVIDKPAGMLTVPFDADDTHTLVDRAAAWLRRTTGAQHADLGVVQRLDKDTTGVLVFARTLAMKRHLQGLLRSHDVERRYLAIVHGTVTRPHRLETQLLQDRGDGLRGSYGHFRRPRGPLPKDARRAVTHIEPLERLRGATLVECKLHTGRQHQIRIHLSELGHPLVGEAVYIRDYSGKPIAAPRPMLHAAVLGFAHPDHGRTMRFERPPPADFAALSRRLR